jgi:hypothetical protein
MALMQGEPPPRVLGMTFSIEPRSRDAVILIAILTPFFAVGGIASIPFVPHGCLQWLGTFAASALVSFLVVRRFYSKLH